MIHLYLQWSKSIYLHKSCKFKAQNFKIQRFNPPPNKAWFSRVYSTSLLKTLWEKEKLLVSSNFSFTHSVFCPFGERKLEFQDQNAHNEQSDLGCIPSKKNLFSLTLSQTTNFRFFQTERFCRKHCVILNFEWCFTSLSTIFSHITATAPIIHVFPGFHQY